MSSLLENQIRKEEDEEAKKEMIELFYGDDSLLGLQKLAVKLSRLLERKVFYTVGPAEARAWAVSKNETARAAAGRIHTDISTGFIYAAVRKSLDGPTKNEGKNYIVEDGDIIEFVHSK